MCQQTSELQRHPPHTHILHIMPAVCFGLCLLTQQTSCMTTLQLSCSQTRDVLSTDTLPSEPSLLLFHGTCPKMFLRKPCSMKFFRSRSLNLRNPGQESFSSSYGAWSLLPGWSQSWSCSRSWSWSRSLVRILVPGPGPVLCPDLGPRLGRQSRGGPGLGPSHRICFS